MKVITLGENRTLSVNMDLLKKKSDRQCVQLWIIKRKEKNKKY